MIRFGSLLAAAIVSACAVPAATAVQQSGPVAEDVDESAAPAGLLSLLPGFDSTRLSTAVQVVRSPPTTEGAEAAAKLLWGLRRLNPDTVESMVQPVGGDSGVESSGVGSRAVRVRGQARSVDAVRVPEALAERLELERLYRVRVETDGGIVLLVTAEVPEAWARVRDLDEPVEATGLAVEGLAVEGLAVEGGSPSLVFAARVRWSPDAESAAVWPAGWQLLSSQGFDCGLLAGVADREKKPLLGSDSQPFYEMLGIAGRLGQQPTDATPRPRPIEVARMLREPRQLVGQWVETELQLARVSRVLVSSDEARKRLGRDWYWQLDAFGDLGDVQIALEPPEGEGEPLLFTNRFPVTLAVVELPEWLEEQISRPSGAAQRIDMSMLRQDAMVQGFFYRLWSYESEYTDSRGGRQVAPLILTATILPRGTAPAAGGGSVNMLGWGLAAVVLMGIVATVAFTWWTGRRDRAILQRRRLSG